MGIDEIIFTDSKLRVFCFFNATRQSACSMSFGEGATELEAFNEALEKIIGE